MSVVAEFLVDADEFLPGRLVAAHPTVTLELEPVVPTTRHAIPYLWGHGPDLDSFETHLSTDLAVREFRVVDRLDQRGLYRIEWDERPSAIATGLARSDATVLEATGTTEWLLRVLFVDHVGLAAFHQFCRARGISHRLRRVTVHPDSPVVHPFGLTDAQYLTLTEAVDRGYFEVPRRVTFAELADEMDISQQAVSERVRRGTNTVLTETLRDTPESVTGDGTRFLLD